MTEKKARLATLVLTSERLLVPCQEQNHFAAPSVEPKSFRIQLTRGIK